MAEHSTARLLPAAAAEALTRHAVRHRLDGVSETTGLRHAVTTVIQQLLDERRHA
jgi:hypothetical protein